jgi:hypothetical protein
MKLLQLHHISIVAELLEYQSFLQLVQWRTDQELVACANGRRGFD